MRPLDRRAFLALGAAVLAACTSESKGKSSSLGFGAPGGTVLADDGTPLTSVVMVGDSITEGSAEVLRGAFTASGFVDVVVEGAASRRIEIGNGKGDAPLSGIGTVFSLIGSGADPSVWVIELGTNDVGSYNGADEYGALIDQLLELISPEVPLVWVNVYRPQYLDDTNVFNLVLADRIEQRGNAVIADWYSLASAPDQTILRSDDLHPNEHGREVLTLVVIDALTKL